jgi:U3 small nucleolar RNA-associated protein 20
MTKTQPEDEGDAADQASEPEEDVHEPVAGEVLEEEEEEEEDTVMKAKDQAMTPEEKADIQDKLLHKVLPVLERHLTELSDKQTVRGFVAVCYAKTIRKLPPHKFNLKLRKLINLIVTQGLRSKDLSHREKARKALVKLLEEISPRFLSLIFDEMKSQLTKGFQQHVYLFSIHALLSGL